MNKASLLLVGLLVLVNLEVLQGVGVLVGGDNSEEVLSNERAGRSVQGFEVRDIRERAHLQLVLLQELLGQVLEVPLGEVGLGGEDELGSWKTGTSRCRQFGQHVGSLTTTRDLPSLFNWMLSPS